jgi:hypothetical protein
MDKVVAALQMSLEQATEPALRAQLTATIERLRRSRDQDSVRPLPRADTAHKTPRRQRARRRS